MAKNEQTIIFGSIWRMSFPAALAVGIAGTRELVEIEDAEAIVGFEKIGVGADVVAGELERTAVDRAVFAEVF